MRNKCFISQYVQVYSCCLNGNVTHVAMLKKRANKRTIVYFQNASIVWERYYRNDYFSRPFRTVLCTTAQLKEHGVQFVVVPGNPRMICGLDVGEFKAIGRYSQKEKDKSIYVAIKKELKQHGIKFLRCKNLDTAT